MREKNRKPIEARVKLPQFTTMHVIEGQAGQINYTSLIFYSLTFNNILNIIVMLILVGVTIATVVDGGLFAKAGVAATQTETEKQNELKLSSGAVTIDGKEYSSIDEYQATLAGTTGGSGTGGDKEYLGMDNEETDSGIGYYVYVDGQYGVIYADLAFDGAGRWSNENGLIHILQKTMQI